MDYYKKSLKIHKEKHGELEIKSKLKIENKEDLAIAYTPGVAEICKQIEKDKELAKDLTFKGNTVAVISDGSAVLGLGNIGPEAGIPVMEGKAILFKEFGGVDAFPIVLNTQDTEEIIQTIKNIAPTFSGINLEDISAPRCFEIEERLQNELDIPVFHDDQHGTAIVVLAGIINALKITLKKKEEIKVVVNGVGAAGTAIIKLLHLWGIKNIIACDSKGIISSKRDNLNKIKKKLLKITNKNNINGHLKDAIKGSDVFIGVSKGNVLNKEMVKSMNKNAIIFAMANPTPEIMPDEAKEAGAAIVATGRSDFPNQINNVLVFPGIFKGALENRIKNITNEIKLKVAESIAHYIKNPTSEYIIPSPLDKNIANIVSKAVK